MDIKTISTTLALLSVLPFAAGPRTAAAVPLPLPQVADTEAWATALRAPDLRQRRASYESLLEKARADATLLDRVRRWADGDADVELAWTAQLMLRELEATNPENSAARGPHALRRAPSIFDTDSLDPFDRSWIDEMLQGMWQGSPFSGHSGVDPFQNLPGRRLQGPGSHSSQESSRFSMGPDGVRLEVEETVDGEATTRTYEADSLEELLETYPELEGKVGIESALPGLDVFGRLRPLQPNGDWPFSDLLEPDHARRPSLDVLGIRMVEPGQRTAEYVGVDAEVGLQVVAVLPGSLAHAIGVRPGELVVSIGGQPISSAADVKRALATQDLEHEIEVECVEPDGTRRTRRWTPRDPDDLGRRLRRGSTRV